MQEKIQIIRYRDGAQDYLHQTEAYISYVVGCSELA